jgi:hypothetical protein
MDGFVLARATNRITGIDRARIEIVAITRRMDTDSCFAEIDRAEIAIASAECSVKFRKVFADSGLRVADPRLLAIGRRFAYDSGAGSANSALAGVGVGARVVVAAGLSVERGTPARRADGWIAHLARIAGLRDP